MSKGHHHDSLLTTTGGLSDTNHNNTSGGANGTLISNNDEIAAADEPGIWNQLPHESIHHTTQPRATAAADQLKPTTSNTSSSGTAPAAGSPESETAPSVLSGTSSGTAAKLVSPVRSRDFAHLGSPVKNVESASEADADLPRGRPAVNNRLQALKRGLNRASSEPNLPVDKQEKNAEDLDKANEKHDAATLVGALPRARASEPQLPSQNAGREDLEAAFGVGDGPTVTTRIAGILEPTKPLKAPPTVRQSLINIIKYTWINVMLVFVPVALGVGYSDGMPPAVTFAISFAAIIPLAALLGFATEELALRVGHTLGGLLNATLGNTVELIVMILALTKGELRVVQASVIGSILSNCLLVLGSCFFAGGIRFHEQIYTIRAAQLNISLLGIAALVIVIPAAFNAALSMNNMANNSSDQDILKISRGVAFILLFVYAAYLFFQFWTHSYLYIVTSNSGQPTLVTGDEEAAQRKVNKYRSRQYQAQQAAMEQAEPQPPANVSVLRMPSWHSSNSSDSDSSSIRSRASGRSTALSRSSTNSSSSSGSSDSSDDEAEEPKLNVYVGIVLILTVTVLAGLIAEFLVSSIDGITANGAISKEFVALILLPLVGNVAEHVSALTVSVKDKLDLSLAIAVGSSLQIALFVLPVLVLLGWAIGQPLSLEFDVLETITLFVSIVIVTQAISDGKSNWLEGLVLIMVYFVIALVFFFYPGVGGL